MEWGTLIASATVSLITVLGAGGIFASRIQRKNIESQTGVNRAEQLLKQSQIEINLSQEARQLLEVYSNDSKAARKEAAEAYQKAERSDRKAELSDRKAKLNEARLEFVLDYYKSKGFPVPTYPAHLVSLEAFDV